MIKTIGENKVLDVFSLMCLLDLESEEKKADDLFYERKAMNLFYNFTVVVDLSRQSEDFWMKKEYLHLITLMRFFGIIDCEQNRWRLGKIKDSKIKGFLQEVSERNFDITRSMI